MNKKQIQEKAEVYALKNAVAHGGKAVQGAVIAGLFAEGLKREDVGKYIKDISEVLKEVNSLSPEEQIVLFKKHSKEISEREVRQEGELPELPGAKKGKVISRFAPNPSGPLHVGHAISNVIPFLLVKKYGGKFYVRIEDTNPEKVMKEGYKSFKEDCDWLYKKGVSEYVIQSDRMDVYYKYAEKLIKSGNAYVCTCSQEEFKKYSEKKKDCPCRKFSSKENKERWERMLDTKGFGPGEAVLRFKSGMENSNPALRDFPLARINLTEHPRQKNKYRVWPLMFLAVAVDDIEYGMTHVIRGKEHRDNALREKMIYEALEVGKKFPWEFYMGRIKFTDLQLGKRFITAAIKEGKYSGWDDPNLPTLASLRKRGYKPEAFWKLAAHRGLTQVDKVMKSKDFFDILDRFNKEVK
jgi:glutamyl-tRNA synthetase